MVWEHSFNRQKPKDPLKLGEDFFYNPCCVSALRFK